MAVSKIRLFMDHPLASGQSVPLSRAQAHYLFGVMRLPQGGALAVFNGRDGEFAASVAQRGKREGSVAIGPKTRPQTAPPDLWLLFAPVKKARTDFIVEKAVELGVARIVPIRTAFTNSERIRRDRLRAHAVEAAEQCGATLVPDIAELDRLDRLLADWPRARQLYFCDEAMAGSADPLIGAPKGQPSAILIGPEGGFSDSERERLRSHKAVIPIGLGPRTLRAETAAIAALALWQANLGDWPSSA